MRYLDITTLKFDQEKCIGCGRCVEVCPHQIFVSRDTISTLDQGRCIECGACQMNCPVDAISVTAGTGCAKAIMFSYLKKYNFINRFIKNK